MARHDLSLRDLDFQSQRSRTRNKHRRKALLSLGVLAVAFGLGHTLSGNAYKTPTPAITELAVKPLGLPPLPDHSPSDSANPAAEEARLHTPKIKLPDWQLFTVHKGDTLSTIFARMGIDPQAAIPVAQASKEVYSLRKLKPGDELAILTSDDNRLEKIRYRIDAEKTLMIEAKADHFSARVRERPLEARKVSTVVDIQDSLFGDGQRAGLSDATILELAKIFRYDIDFAQDIHPGAKLMVIHEAKYTEGRKVKDGDILAAEFLLNGESHRLMRFQLPDGTIKYVDPKGKLTERAFIRTPVAVARISSYFSKARLHPVLGKWRAHKGVDYAAPTGTPVVATANATVVHAGPQGGYGNLIVLRYNQHISMAYGHLSRFAKGIRPGVKVKLGQVIGYVGQTGLASGPHLHYELRWDGVARDPLTVALPGANPLPAEYRTAFRQQAAEYTALLDQLNATTQVAMR